MAPSADFPSYEKLCLIRYHRYSLDVFFTDVQKLRRLFRLSETILVVLKRSKLDNLYLPLGHGIISISTSTNKNVVIYGFHFRWLVINSDSWRYPETNLWTSGQRPRLRVGLDEWRESFRVVPMSVHLCNLL